MSTKTTHAGLDNRNRALQTVMTTAKTQLLQIGEAVLDPSTGTLHRSDRFIPSETTEAFAGALSQPPDAGGQGNGRQAESQQRLEPKVMAVLLYLAERQGKVVSRRELLDTLWPGVIVTDEVLTRCISELRSAFGDERNQSRYIETLPKRGYRLLATVKLLDAQDQVASAPSQPKLDGSMQARNHRASGPTSTTSGEESAAFAGAFQQAQTLGSNPTSNPINGSTPNDPTLNSPSAQGGELPQAIHASAVVRRPWWGTAAALVAATALVLGFWWLRPTDLSTPINRVADDPPMPPEPPARIDTSEFAVSSLAVLPFADLSANADYGYFVDGLTDELHSVLYHLDDLDLVARTRSARFARALTSGRADAQQIGQALGVEAVLEGSVRREGQRIRVSARLVDVASGKQRWAQSYDRALADLFAIQDDIAQSIAKELRIQLAAPLRVSRPSNDLAALDLYLLGRHHSRERTRNSLIKATEFFEKAIEQDPRFALAYVGLADSYLLQSNYGFQPEAVSMKVAKDTLAKALQIDPELPAAMATQGLIQVREGNLGAAQITLERAVAADPGNATARMWLGSVLENRGQLVDAISTYELAYFIDPTLAPLVFNLANAEINRGNPQAALRYVDESEGLGVAHGGFAATRSHAYRAMGNWNAALSESNRAVQEHPDDQSGHLALIETWIDLNELERARQTADQVPQAARSDRLRKFTQIIDSLRQGQFDPNVFDDPYQQAIQHIQNGTPKQALPLLESLLTHDFGPKERLEVLTHMLLITANKDQSDRLAGEITSALKTLRESGFGDSRLAFYEAAFNAAEGKASHAIALLRQHPELLTNYLMAHDLRFASLKGNPAWEELRAIAAARTSLVVAEFDRKNP